MSLKKNIIANYLGQGWRAIMALAFVPLYIEYLGIEAYGLIGIFTMLQAWLMLLEMGMKPALVREMARFTGGSIDSQSIWNLLRSVEVIMFCIAILTGFGIWIASDWLATEWVQAEKMPVGVIAHAFTLMGLVAALRLIENIYTSSIAGLQRQVLQNVITSTMATFQGLGAVAVLVWIEPTIDVFFIWQGVITLITTVIFMTVTYYILPKPQHVARFSLVALTNIRSFAVGMFGITLLSLMLMQIDKILLSRLLPLEVFGYYVLASLVAGGLYIIITPIGAAFYPRFIELLTRNDNQALIRVYHLGSQLVTVLMGSAAMVLILYSERIILLWTSDPALTEQVAPVMMVLVLGTFFNGLMWMPYQMQLAHGWTSLSIRINIIAVVLLVPTIMWVVPIYGAVGAAWVWVVLNAAYFLIGVHFMYRRILNTEKWIWYLNDIFFPLIAAGVTALLCQLILPEQLGRIGELAVLASISIIVLIATSLSAPLVRQQGISRIPIRLYNLFYRLNRKYDQK
jgi:O-antigen/teichoic acid export membrane protein